MVDQLFVRPGLPPQTEQVLREHIDGMADQLLDMGDPHRIGYFPNELKPGWWLTIIAEYELPEF